MGKNFALGVAFIAAFVSAFSYWRWQSCGYDCGIFGVSSGPAALVVTYAAVLTGLAALGAAAAFTTCSKWRRQ